MGLSWSLRFAAAMVLLRASRATAWAFRGLHRGPPPPSLGPALPTAPYDRGPRHDRLVQALAELRLIPVAERFGLAEGFDHLTVARLPPSHHYPWTFALPKTLLAWGLGVDLRDAPSVTPSPARWLGAPSARRLGWDGDAAFAALRVQGPNAGWIRRDGSRYVVDLRMLDGIPVRPDRVVSGCLATFDLALRPLGIEVGGRWVAAGASDWPAARRAFACADLHVHEAVSHFSWTHMVGEKLLLATLRRLDVCHPIRRLLEPHFAGTLQANENSGQRLLGPDGLFGRCFSAGWPGVVALIRKGEAVFTWDRLVLPRDLAERDVLDLPSYPYRDDGRLVWDALDRYVGAVVDAWYGADREVVADPELAAWSLELRGWLPSFPVVASRAALREVLCATLYVVVQHTLVNALQYDAFGDPEVWPASLRADGSLPGGLESLDATRATFGFSIQYNTLGDGLASWHDARTRSAADRLSSDLAAARSTIDAREAHRPWPYQIARPDRVSNSINA